MRRSRLIAAVLAALFVAASQGAGVAWADSDDRRPALSPSDERPEFDFALAQEVANASGLRSDSSSRSTDELFVRAQTVADQWAMVDSTLVKSAEEGAAYALLGSHVDVSWAPMDDVVGYRLVVDGSSTYETTDTAYRFEVSSVAESFHHVQILPEAAPGKELTLDAPIYGLQVFVPASSDAYDAAAARLAADKVTTMASGPFSNTSIVWRTFIPTARIDAPTLPGAPCDYGAGYEFDGNNRGYSTSFYGDWPSKTSLRADIFWGAQSAFEGSGIVADSSVYSKATGQLIETRQVTGETVEVRKLGHTANTTDVRFSLQASIPYCDMNSIAGAFTISVTKTGGYSIPSGSHRQMPNHEVLIHSTWSNGGALQTAQAIAYRRDLYDPLCLIGTWACAEATMSGTAGTY